MALTNIKHIEKEGGSNVVISKSIKIDEELFCYVVVSDTNSYTVNMVFNKIIDSILENISDKEKNVYGNLSYSLEQVNFFMAKIEKEWTNLNNLDAIIWIREKNIFHFSKIWEASCTLYSRNTVSELSYMPDNREKRFDYISSWDLKHSDNIFISNDRILDYTSKSDLIESSNLETVAETADNVEKIFLLEEIEKNTDFIVVRFENFVEIQENQDSKIKDKIEHMLLVASDNMLIKGIIARFLLAKDFVEKQNKHLKTSFFIIWIFISLSVLYNIVWGVIEKTMEKENVARYEIKLLEAEKFKEIAYQNINNPENFNLNIEKSEELLKEIKEKNLFIDDVNKMIVSINTLKKDFNWIEVFSPTLAEPVYKWELTDSVRTLIDNWKIYIINKTSVTGAIINWKSNWNFWFNWLWDDEFIDASYDNVKNRIIILTKKWRVLSYDLKWNFKYLTVEWEESWPKWSYLKTFSGNIYLVDDAQSQIYKFTPNGSNFTKWVWYLKEADVENYNKAKINSIDIDGWIYILRNDLVLDKFFSVPDYKIQGIRLNKLPKNYNLDDVNEKVQIIARNNLNYVYFFFNNTIWVFKPNSNRYQDVKSLEFIGQIEWESEDIKDIYVSLDNVVWEIFVTYSSWIYKLKFDVTEDWITIL